MQKNFKSIFVLLMLFVSLQIKAQEDVVVAGLSQQSCWTKVEQDSLRVSSFSENLSFEINQNSIAEFLSEHLNLTNRPEVLNTFVHCGSYGHALIFNIKLKNRSYCIWGQYANNKIDVRSIGGSDESENICDGFVLGQLILKKSEGSTWNNIHKILTLYMQQGTISDYQLFGKGHIKIILNEKDYFKENLFGSKLIQLDEFDYFEKENFYHPVGESIKIEELSL